jgi:hypothetical protein
MAEKGIGCGRPTGAMVDKSAAEEHVNEEKTIKRRIQL